MSPPPRSGTSPTPTRRSRRPVRLDRRGIATLEFACALPFVFLLTFGLADVVQVGRANLRVQSAAIQVGQIISQCQEVNSSDEAVLKDLAARIIDPSGKNVPFALRVTAFGRDSGNNAITPWTINQSGGTAKTGETAPTISGSGSTVPPGYTMDRNRVLFRTEVVASVDQTPLQRAVSLLTRDTRTSTAVTPAYTTARGQTVHSARAGDTDALKTKGGSTAKGCLT